MKVKTLALAAGATALIAAGSATASIADSFLGIDVVKFNNYMGNLGDGEALPGNWGQTTGAHPLAGLHSAHANSGLTTYRLYATFDSDLAGGVVQSIGTVSGDAAAGQVNAKSGTFWHAPVFDSYGEPIPGAEPRLSAPNAPFPAGEELRAADTYITIGEFVNPTTNWAPNSEVFRAQTNNMGDGQSSFGYQDSGLFHGAGSGIAPSTSQQGLVDDGLYRVLVMQLTVQDADPKLGVNGTLGHLGFLDADNNPFSLFADDLMFSSGQLPAPGALALLGLAGLVGTRRRRA
jgi:MYXO-CTERM domain-containing protein